MNRENLKEYIKEIERQKQNNSQFNNIFLDQHNTKSILRYFNVKYHSMNAHEQFIDNIGDFIENALDVSPNQHKRYIIKTDTAGTGVHFAAANVFKDIKNNVSIIFVDPSLGENIFIPFQLKYSEKRKKHNDKLKTLYIYSQIQNSPADCLLFCLHFIKKMHKYSQHFTEIHRNIFNNAITFINEYNKYYSPRPREKLLSDEICVEYQVVCFDQAIKLLPIDFFKHSHSMKPIHAYLQHHPSKNAITVNKKGETLEARYQSHIVTRNIDGKQRTYSKSIEEKRLSLAKAALITETEKERQMAMALLWLEESN
ncbi:type III secretion system effector VopA, acetyltransferase [Xenorhabdus beddingii]|uniref:Type III secretion system effector VopA, acetyltransferase n=1 Tax=Xenorhabdus beddingii TaxID=40578 RepID=A0A1Y2SMH3_9GAMM|nr:YopJ family acetyltransferase [Xenorhabdus beddingii]OTA19767.1 type III secretion system effector VopA, acetyltransferase [Xenorhabdus beddingii]